MEAEQVTTTSTIALPEPRTRGRQRINPWKLFKGVFVPEWLLRIPSQKLSPGAKICYARLIRFAGRNGCAFPRQDKLARSMGVSPRQVKRYVKELTDTNLIEAEQGRLGDINRYFFLRHGWMGLEQVLLPKTPGDTSVPPTGGHVRPPSPHANNAAAPGTSGANQQGGAKGQKHIDRHVEEAREADEQRVGRLIRLAAQDPGVFDRVMQQALERMESWTRLRVQQRDWRDSPTLVGHMTDVLDALEQQPQGAQPQGDSHV